MMTFGPIAFLDPLLLAALAALPAIWWLLRATPPRPQKIVFPPTVLMKDLQNKEQTPRRTPWWLTALRMLLATFVILGLAGPVFNPDKQEAIGNGPVIAVVDNGWSSAKNWQSQEAYLSGLIRRASLASRPMALVTTADDGRKGAISLEAPNKIKELAASLKPLPYEPDRLTALENLKSGLSDVENPSIFWLSDGLDHGHGNEFAQGLKALAGSSGKITVIQNDAKSSPLGLVAMPHASSELKAKVIRTGGPKSSGELEAYSARGDLLGKASFDFEANGRESQTKFDFPLELRNQVSRLEIAGEQSAGAVFLLDARSQRQRIGLISGEGGETSQQPLLSPIYYVEKALGPFASLIASPDKNIATATTDLLSQNPSTLILADIGKIVGHTAEQIGEWVDKGGVLIRFAGPRLEKDGDDLLPVALRQGGRTLGGALSWSTPQTLAPFEENSIFRGLEVPEDVTVSRQVLADPARLQSETQIWARLQDGTPLVTAAKKGEGWLVLFHVTANSDWSRLPHSGLFVEMLRRLTELSNFVGAPPAKENEEKTAAPEAQSAARNYAQTEILPPFQTLDGFGRLTQPPPLTEPVSIADIDKVKPSAKNPPGLYGTASATRVINVIGPKSSLTAIKDLPQGTKMSNYSVSEPLSLKPWLLTAALLFFCLDAIIIMIIGGAFSRANRGLKPARQFGALLLVAALGSALHPAPLFAADDPPPTNEEAFALKAALKTRLAYVITGNTDIDDRSKRGLDGLSRVVAARTAIEPGEPMGVDVNRDELAFFPILYWPMREDAETLPEKTLARIDAYMKQGGLILFDTRDYQRTMNLGGTSTQGPGAAALQRVLGKLDIPRLEPVPAGHVLTKSFYLLDNFPGRWDGGTLWVEAREDTRDTGERRARRADGVSSILITSNDFASAWALDERNRPVYPVVPGGEIQREMSFRAGINIMMYALTGNYKADQVHIPALLERLGQ